MMLDNATVINTVIVFSKMWLQSQNSKKKEKNKKADDTMLYSFKDKFTTAECIIQLKRGVFSGFQDQWRFLLHRKHVTDSAHLREHSSLFSRFAPHTLSTSLKRKMESNWMDMIFQYCAKVLGRLQRTAQKTKTWPDRRLLNEGKCCCVILKWTLFHFTKPLRTIYPFHMEKGAWTTSSLEVNLSHKVVYNTILTVILIKMVLV